MEVLAVGASVAGLLSLAGQCITGAQALRDLYRDISLASRTLDAFLKDIDAMIGTLNDVVRLLRTATDSDPGPYASLSVYLEDCKRDIQMWLANA